MTRARCWNLRFNLDIFNAAFASLDTDQERSDFLVGFSRGVNAGKVKDDCSDPMSVGFAIGTEMRGEAEGFRAKSVENGSKRKSNGNDQMVYQMVDQTGTQSTIHNPQTTNNNPEAPKASSPSRARQSAEKKEMPPIPEELLPFLETLTRDWPRRSHDGRRVTILRPKDSWEKICKNRGDDDPKIPVNAALAYLDTNPAQYVIGMDNFFGVARKYTKFVVED